MTEINSYWNKFLKMEWDAIAGVIAASIAIIMHLLHIIESDVLLTLSVVLLALLFIRNIRHENSMEKIREELTIISNESKFIKANIIPTDAILIGPNHLRQESEKFSRNAKGDMIWFHVCLLMFKNQGLFDLLLKPAIENPLVTSLLFILDEDQKEMWANDVLPKINKCTGKEKVSEPKWTTINENISIIISENSHHDKTECLLSFWGEPFMARKVGNDVPRFIFLVQHHSELVTHLVELTRNYRFKK